MSLPEPLTEFPPPTEDFYKQFRQEDAVESSLYDVTFAPNPRRLYKNRSALVIDSRDRVSGTPDCYEYNIDDLYYDVISVELKLADIPHSTYLINQCNNQFYFQDTCEQVRRGEFYQVTIPVGNYLAESDKSVSLQALLEAGMNEASNNSTYEVTVSRHTNKFTITQTSGSGFFNVYFVSPEKEHNKDRPDPTIQFFDPLDRQRKERQHRHDKQCHDEEATSCHQSLVPCVIENTMEVVLGFSRRNFFVKSCNGDQPTLVSNITFNLKQDKYLVLRIESDGRPWRRVNSRNSSLKDAFAVLPYEFKLNNFEFLSNLDRLNNEILIVDFKEPVKVGRLKIRFTTRDGKPVDFNGQDHLLVFEVTSLSRVDNYHV
jgi:hypothetical protein